MPSRTIVKIFALAAVAALAAAAQAGPAAAQVLSGKTEVLTAEEQAERESRKACKVQICSALHNRKPGDDVACNITKSWRKEQLDKIVGKGGISWPWGKVVCVAPIKMKRDMLITALAGPKVESEIGQQSLACTVEGKEASDAKSEIKADFSPKVTFEGGKATKAFLNWGKIDAPTLVKGAMWTATATDNTFNVLQGMIVEDINRFATEGCDEVKEEWAGK
jgi:hypothetical protein